MVDPTIVAVHRRGQGAKKQLAAFSADCLIRPPIEA